MASNDKEEIEKVFCLFHQKTDCRCIAPVTKEKDLAYRLEHIINLNNFLNKYEANEAAAGERAEATKAFQSRFDGLVNL